MTLTATCDDHQGVFVESIEEQERKGLYYYRNDKTRFRGCRIYTIAKKIAH